MSYFRKTLYHYYGIQIQTRLTISSSCIEVYNCKTCFPKSHLFKLFPLIYVHKQIQNNGRFETSYNQEDSSHSKCFWWKTCF